MDVDFDFFFNLRKKSHIQFVKGVISSGKTVRSRNDKTPICSSCRCDSCEHIKEPDYKDLIYKYTDNSRLQKKNVHKCDCCSDTHICEHNIPVRGRHIKPIVDYD